MIILFINKYSRTFQQFHAVKQFNCQIWNMKSAKVKNKISLLKLNLNSLLILRLWSLRFLKICNFRSESRVLRPKDCWKGVLQTVRRTWRGQVFKVTNARIPFSGSTPQNLSDHKCWQTLVAHVTHHMLIFWSFVDKHFFLTAYAGLFIKDF